MPIFILLLLLITGCARGPLKNKDQAMRLTERIVEYRDDLDFGLLLAGLETQVVQLEKSYKQMKFGPFLIKSTDYAIELRRLLNAGRLYGSGAFFKHLDENFVKLEVFGQKKWGEVFVTSYFEPDIAGSTKKTNEFNSPVYGIPKDLVTIRLDQFGQKLEPWSTWLRDSDRSTAKGRLVKTPEGYQVGPYLSRQEIEEQGLKDAPVLAWVNPVDNFVLQIQGSGAITLKDGEKIRVGYAGQNGYPYVAVGKAMVDKIPLAEMNLQKIENHLKTISPDEGAHLMATNPSFVFFRKLETRGVTYFGTETIPGRTIATDTSLFPKGALALLQFDKPKIKEGTLDEIESTEFVSRLVFDQDTGGAIRGAHRVDLFWGDGEMARRHAGVMKNSGRLYYFFPRSKIE